MAKGFDIFHIPFIQGGPEGVKRELGLALFWSGKIGLIGFTSLGLGLCQICQKWEWDKKFETTTSLVITYFLELRDARKSCQAPSSCQPLPFTIFIKIMTSICCQ